MADNTVQTGADTLRTEDRSGVKTQIIGIDLSPGGTESLMNGSMPVTFSNSYSNGSITAVNANATGAATANSAVAVILAEGHSAFDVHLSGTFSATTTLAFQGSLDGTNWFPVEGRLTGTVITNDTSTTIGSDTTGPGQQNWRGVIGGIRYFRVVCTAFQAGDNVFAQINTSAAVGGSFLTAALPPGSSMIGYVNTNGNQRSTYMVSQATSTGALVASTAKPILSLHHAATATKTVRVRRIVLGLTATTATAGAVFATIMRGTAASTAGTTTTPQPSVPGTAAAEVTANINPTIVAATEVLRHHYGTLAASSSLASQVIYDWQTSGEQYPLTLRAGFLDSLVVSLTSSAVQTITPSLTVYLTEE